MPVLIAVLESTPLSLRHTITHKMTNPCNVLFARVFVFSVQVNISHKLLTKRESKREI